MASFAVKEGHRRSLPKGFSVSSQSVVEQMLVTIPGCAFCKRIRFLLLKEQSQVDSNQKYSFPGSQKILGHVSILEIIRLWRIRKCGTFYAHNSLEATSSAGLADWEVGRSLGFLQRRPSVEALRETDIYDLIRRSVWNTLSRT